MMDRRSELGEEPETPSGSRSAPRSIAPWWHTALVVLLIVGLSYRGRNRLPGAGSPPGRLTADLLMSIAYEWFLAGAVLLGIRLRGISLRRLLGDRRPGLRAWAADFAAALIFWAIANLSLAALGQLLQNGSHSHIDLSKIANAAASLTPATGVEMALFLTLSVSAGVCEELIFRGYLQQQFICMTGRVWAGVALAALVFGSAHEYEGAAGVLLLAAYGAMFGVLALVRRRLRTGMIAHAWHDSIGGVTLVLVRHYGLHLGSR